MAEKKNTGKIIAVNRKARHDYFVEDTYEAGVALFGTEVKSSHWADTIHDKREFPSFIPPFMKFFIRNKENNVCPKQ